MKLFILSFLAGAALTFGIAFGYAHRHPLKHTQNVQLVYVDSREFYFQRPNHEVFIMYFEDPVPAGFHYGMQFRDVAYQDGKNGMVYFVKATLQ